jgi:hypothetical protein
LVQVPCALLSAHDLHGPAQAVLQQTPCAQKPDKHSMPLLHEAPGIFLPHEFSLQALGGTQFPSCVQTSKHLLPLQANGAHERDMGAAQLPLLSQVEPGV